MEIQEVFILLLPSDSPPPGKKEVVCGSVSIL